MYAIVSGASKGLGKSIAIKLASRGYDLFLGARNESMLQATSAEITAAHNVKVSYMVADMGNKEEAIAFGKAAINNTDHVHVLVNNVGVFMPGKIHEEEDGLLEHQMSVNVFSAYHLTRTVMPRILSTPHAHIFNICSIASQIAYPNGGSYSISKFALLGFSKVLRQELMEKQVKVTAILPGAAWSDSWAGVELPHDRLMASNDVAEALVACLNLSHAACIEEIVLRPQLGDL